MSPHDAVLTASLSTRHPHATLLTRRLDGEQWGGIENAVLEMTDQTAGLEAAAYLQEGVVGAMAYQIL